MQGVVYEDDSAIVSKRAEKRYGDDPRVDLNLAWTLQQTRA